MTGRLGFTRYTSQDDTFYPSNYATLYSSDALNFYDVSPEDGDEYFDRGLYNQSIYKKTNIASDIVLSYSKQINKHLLFANAQFNISSANAKQVSYEATGFNDSATEITQARNYKEDSKPYGYDDKVHELGGLLSVNYSFDNRLMVDANYRLNGSSLFGANNRWGHFWSAGAGWNIHNEKFMDNTEWLDMLKVRGSYGYSGKQNFSAYQAIATYQFFDTDIYKNTVGAYLLAMHNPDLKWELTKDQSFGFDMSVLDNRLDFTFDYYIKDTENLLTPITSVTSIGFDTYIENLGKTENKGYEIRANYRVIKSSQKDIYLSVFGSVAKNYNILVELNESLRSHNESTLEEYDIEYSYQETPDLMIPKVLYQEGVSFDAIWAVPSLGIDPTTGEEVFVKRDGTFTNDWNSNDLRPMGNSQPKYRGTFGVNLDYKGFTLNANFSYKLGGQYYNQTLADYVEGADIEYNVDKRVFTDRWNSEDKGDAKFLEIEQFPSYTRATSRFIQDLNELNMTSLNVGYDFRNCAFIRNSKSLERLRVSFAANELLRFSTVKTERGIYYPYAKSFIFTLQATF